MDKEQRQAIVDHWDTLAESMPSNHMTNRLIAEGVLSPTDLQEINAKETENKKNTTILNKILASVSPDCYAIFIDALRQIPNKNSRLADMIESRFKEQASADYRSDASKSNNLSRARKRQTVGQLESETSRQKGTAMQNAMDPIRDDLKRRDSFMYIANNIKSIKVIEFGRKLRLSENDVDDIVNSNRSRFDKFMNLLEEWHSQFVSTATFDKLLDTLRSCNEVVVAEKLKKKYSISSNSGGQKPKNSKDIKKETGGRMVIGISLVIVIAILYIRFSQD